MLAVRRGEEKRRFRSVELELLGPPLLFPQTKRNETKRRQVAVASATKLCLVVVGVHLQFSSLCNWLFSSMCLKRKKKNQRTKTQRCSGSHPYTLTPHVDFFFCHQNKFKRPPAPSVSVSPYLSLSVGVFLLVCVSFFFSFFSFLDRH